MSRIEIKLALAWGLIVVLGLVHYGAQLSVDSEAEVGIQSASSRLAVGTFRGGELAPGGLKKGPSARDLLPDGSAPPLGISQGRLIAGSGGHSSHQPAGRVDPGRGGAPGYAAAPSNQRAGNYAARPNARNSGRQGSSAARTSGSRQMGFLPFEEAAFRSSSSVADREGADPSIESGYHPQRANRSGFSASSGNWDREGAFARKSEEARATAAAYSYGDDNYYCRTAREIRQVCDGGARNAERYEFCLSFAGYYTNSRHCGYHP